MLAFGRHQFCLGRENIALCHEPLLNFAHFSSPACLTAHEVGAQLAHGVGVVLLQAAVVLRGRDEVVGPGMNKQRKD